MTLLGVRLGGGGSPYVARIPSLAPESTTLIKMPRGQNRNKPAKSWVFTHNNWTPAVREQYERLDVNYIIFGEEVGESGTPHLQGYIIFKRAYRLSQLVKMVPGAHWEVAVAVDAGNYCTKGENIYEKDNRRQGKRNDLEAAAELLKAEGLRKVAEQMPEMYIKFGTGMHRLASFLEPGRTEKPHVVYCWGKTGTGKTRYVHEMEDPDKLWISSGSLRWFDGYMGQEAALLDDFRQSHCKFEYLLRVLDRYPMRVEFKGGYTQWVPKRIYITAPCRPEELYGNEGGEDVAQLLRRIDEVLEFPLLPYGPATRDEALQRLGELGRQGAVVLQ